MSSNQRHSRLQGQNIGGLLTGVGASIMGGGAGMVNGLGSETRITMNLEDVSLHE